MLFTLQTISRVLFTVAPRNILAKLCPDDLPSHTEICYLHDFPGDDV